MGAISPWAKGVVRIRMRYERADGSAALPSCRATISRGRRRPAQRQPAEAARAGGQLSIRYTGSMLGRIGGQATSEQVAGSS